MKNLKNMKRAEILVAYLMLAPALIIFFGFIGGPIAANVFYLSMTRYNILTPPEFVFMDNFIRFFNDPLAHVVFSNTFRFVIFLVPAHMLLGLVLAMLVSTVRNGPLRAFFRTSIYFPSIVTTASVAIAFIYLFDTEFGVINWFLRVIGIIPEGERGIPWLMSSSLSLPVILIFSLWKTVGDKFLFYLIGIQNIPESYLEAARIDGANSRQVFFRITLPLLTPTIFFVMLTTTIGAIQIFDEPFLITRGGPGDSSRTVALYIYQTAFTSLDMGYASTIATVLFFIIFVITIVQLKTEKYWANYDYE